MKKNFIAGLAILLPLAVTIAIVSFVINFLTEPFVGAVSSLLNYFHIVDKGFLFLSAEQLIRYGSQLLILLLLFVLTLGLGILARWFLINALLNLGDRILKRIPIVNTVYKTTQEIIKTLFVSNKETFKQVVMVPFPRQDIYILGMISSNSPEICSQAAKEDLITVLIPTTPNPTTGFLLMCRKKDLIFINMKSEEAIKYIVSCGVIAPKTFTSPLPEAHTPQ